MTPPSLPFQLSSEATAKWLQSLSQLNSINIASQLNTVIKTLRSSDQDIESTLKILIQLTPTVLHVSSVIEDSVTAETTIKPNNKSQKIEKLCVQLLKNLSLAFYLVSHKKLSSEHEKSQSIFFAIQLIGYTQRMATIFHQIPSASLWKKTGEIYSLALNQNTLQQPIKHKVSHLKNLSTFEAVLKRNLLFSISAPYQHSSKNIKNLFSIAEKYSYLLHLSPDNRDDHFFYWNFNSAQSPDTKNKIEQQNNHTIYINSSEITALIQSNDFSNNLESNTLSQLSHRLSAYKNIIDASVASTLDIKHLIIGYADIISYLEKTSKLQKIEQLSSQLVENKTNTMSLESVKLETLNACSSTKPLPSSHSTLLKNIPTVKILQTTENQFEIAETNSAYCNIGDITLLCDNQLKSEIGIIRQIKTTNQSGTTHILIEKISGLPAAETFYISETDRQYFITLTKDSTNKAVFINPAFFSNKIFNHLNSDNKENLEKLVGYSHFYRYYLI